LELLVVEVVGLVRFRFAHSRGWCASVPGCWGPGVAGAHSPPIQGCARRVVGMLRHTMRYLADMEARRELTASLREVLNGFLQEVVSAGVNIRTEEGLGTIGPSWVQAAYETIEETPPDPEAVALSIRIWVETEDRALIAALREDLLETLGELGFSVWQAAGLVIIDLTDEKVAMVGFCRAAAASPPVVPVAEDDNKENVFE
jgi:hypothetical protein